MEHTLNKALFIIFPNFTCFFKKKNHHFMLVHLVVMVDKRNTFCVAQRFLIFENDQRFSNKILKNNMEKTLQKAFANFPREIHIYGRSTRFKESC